MHDFHEIAIITCGIGQHFTEHATWPVQVGDVVVIGGRRPHCYDDIHNLELVNVLFRRESLIFKSEDLRNLDGFKALFGTLSAHPPACLQHRFRLCPNDLNFVLATVAVMEKELSKLRPGGIYLARAHFMILIATLSRLYSRQSGVQTNVVLRLAKAINYMEAHYREDLHLADIARAAGMSGRQLQRLFKLGTGGTPLAHLQNLRLMNAASALRDPENRVTEVATACGFSDSNYFSRQFRKLTGLSPSKYRHNMTTAA